MRTLVGLAIAWSAAACVVFTDTSVTPGEPLDTGDADVAQDVDAADAEDTDVEDTDPSDTDLNDTDASTDASTDPDADTIEDAPTPTTPTDPCADGGYAWCDPSGSGRVYCDVVPRVEYCRFGCEAGECLDPCDQDFGCSAAGTAVLECMDGVAEEVQECGAGTSCVNGACRTTNACEIGVDECDPFRNLAICAAEGTTVVTVPCESGCRLVWPDADGDGWGDKDAAAMRACGTPDGTAANNDDCDDTQPSDPDTPCTGWVPIPPGSFTLGTPPGEVEPLPDLEVVQRSVRLTSGYLMLETEVTQAMWRRFATVESDPSLRADCPTCPVERVNWFDALFFANDVSAAYGYTECYDLSECTGPRDYGDGCEGDAVSCSGIVCDTIAFVEDCDGFRLPTEAEWEWAARAETLGPYPAELDTIAWYRETTEEPRVPQPAGGLEPNGYGLYDTHGNVYEWVEDVARVYPESEARIDDPVEGRSPEDVSSGETRVLRGGAVVSVAAACRSAHRNAASPQSRTANYGFRLVRTWEP